MISKIFSSGILLCALFAFGCSSNQAEEEAKSTKKTTLGKLTIEKGWARPGSKGQSSAAYLSISNGTASQDSIISISTKAAQKAEIHESYKGENGIMGMRPAPGQVIPSGEDLYLQPGGLHIMLMKLKNDLAVKDSVDLSVKFKNVGTKTISIPVQIQN